MKQRMKQTDDNLSWASKFWIFIHKKNIGNDLELSLCLVVHESLTVQHSAI
jgi:hypothetical protein